MTGVQTCALPIYNDWDNDDYIWLSNSAGFVEGGGPAPAPQVFGPGTYTIRLSTPSEGTYFCETEILPGVPAPIWENEEVDVSDPSVPQVTFHNTTEVMTFQTPRYTWDFGDFTDTCIIHYGYDVYRCEDDDSVYVGTNESPDSGLTACTNAGCGSCVNLTPNSNVGDECAGSVSGT